MTFYAVFQFYTFTNFVNYDISNLLQYFGLIWWYGCKVCCNLITGSNIVLILN